MTAGLKERKRPPRISVRARSRSRVHHSSMGSVKRSFGEFENLLSDAEIFLTTVASRMLAATVALSKMRPLSRPRAKSVAVGLFGRGSFSSQNGAARNRSLLFTFRDKGADLPSLFWREAACAAFCDSLQTGQSRSRRDSHSHQQKSRFVAIAIESNGQVRMDSSARERADWMPGSWWR